MKLIKLLSVFALMTILTGAATAQDAVESYLKQSDPYVIKLQNTIQTFLQEIKPLREKKDLVGLKNVADKYMVTWDGYVKELSQIQPPSEAKTYHSSLVRLHELQRESNTIMSETLGQRIQVVLAARKMKEEGKSQEDIDAFLAKNEVNRDALMKRTSAVKTETQSADSTMKSERQKLLAMVKPKEEQK